jgi:hypothetical protein
MVTYEQANTGISLKSDLSEQHSGRKIDVPLKRAQQDVAPPIPQVPNRWHRPMLLQHRTDDNEPCTPRLPTAWRPQEGHLAKWCQPTEPTVWWRSLSTKNPWFLQDAIQPDGSFLSHWYVDCLEPSQYLWLLHSTLTDPRTGLVISLMLKGD